LGERTLNSEPAFNILAPFGYREIPRLKQRREVKLRRSPVNYRGGWIDLAELIDQMATPDGPFTPFVRSVWSGRFDRERDLLQAFKMPVHRLLCSRDIDHANNPARWNRRATTWSRSPAAAAPPGIN